MEIVPVVASYVADTNPTAFWLDQSFCLSTSTQVL